MYKLSSFYIINLMKKNSICAILWRDAAYTFETKVPSDLPQPRLTTGFVIETDNDYTFIAMNVSYNEETGELFPIDGIVIPKKTIMKFKKIDDYK